MNINTMKLNQTYTLNIQGRYIGEMAIRDTWNDFIELDGGPNRGKIIIRRKGWTNGKKWAKESNAFIEQELDILYADSRYNLPETEVIFVKPILTTNKIKPGN